MKAKIPPDAVFLVCGTLMWLIARFSQRCGFMLSHNTLWFCLLLFAGFIVLLLAQISLSRHNTTARPQRSSLPDTKTLVTTGIYNYTRNPIYLGMAIMLFAWMIFLENWLSSVGLLVFVGFITKYQILIEEDALGKTFGGAYARYKKQVRRWI